MQEESIGCGTQALCINDSVQRLANATRINEKCLDLQASKGRKKVVTEEQGSTKASSKSQSGCPFRKANMTSQRQLKVSSSHHELSGPTCNLLNINGTFLPFLAPPAEGQFKYQVNFTVHII